MSVLIVNIENFEVYVILQNINVKEKPNPNVFNSAMSPYYFLYAFVI